MRYLTDEYIEHRSRYPSIVLERDSELVHAHSIPGVYSLQCDDVRELNKVKQWVEHVAQYRLHDIYPMDITEREFIKAVESVLALNSILVYDYSPYTGYTKTVHLNHLNNEMLEASAIISLIHEPSFDDELREILHDSVCDIVMDAIEGCGIVGLMAETGEKGELSCNLKYASLDLSTGLLLLELV